MIQTMTISMNFRLICAICIIPFFIIQNADATTVEKVFVLFRHGARLPITVKRLNSSDSVPLTNKGKVQSFNLGQWLRNEYPGLLEKKYNAKEIYARSSDVDRCIMTVQGVLAGLYYPIHHADKWSDHENIQWSPIPVHTYPKHLDDMLYSNRDLYCPKMQKLQKIIIANLRKRYPEFFDYFENQIKSETDTADELNLILMEYFRLNPIPPIITPEDVDRLIEDGLSMYYNNPEWKKIDTGPLIHDLLQNINRHQKMHLYGTHDNIIWSMLFALEVEKPKEVNFISTIVFELHVENITLTGHAPKKYIKIFHINGPSAPVQVKRLPDCDELCPLEKFEEFVRPLIVENWYKECQKDVK